MGWMSEKRLMEEGAADRRLETYLDRIAAVLGHADRAGPVRSYCTGLLLPGERKSVEPMAARLAPERVQAAHQSLHHLIAKADWSDAAVLGVVRETVLPAIERHGPIAFWIIDDTGFPKKGKRSVGVARQYCGPLGKQDNRQVAVTLSLANDQASRPIAYRLYLPEAWAQQEDLRCKAGIPAGIVFQTKPEIALAQVRQALADGTSKGIVLADAGYGNDTDVRTALTQEGLAYVVGIQASISLWPPGAGPLSPKPWNGRGRPPRLLRRDAGHQPKSAKELAQGLPETAWQTVAWREGTRGKLTPRFAAIRVRPAHRDYWRAEPHAEEWLLIEWPAGETEPSKYWLSTLPENIALARLIATAKARWRIERDLQDLKQEIGVGHFEGRGWRGFHHHASLCIAAYGFLVAERCLLPPEQRLQSRRLTAPELPQGFRPRGARAA